MDSATIAITVAPIGVSTSTSTPAIGPTGTAPGLNFIQPTEPAIDDSSNTTTFGWPLGFAAVILLVLFTSVLIRARRARSSRPGH